MDPTAEQLISRLHRDPSDENAYEALKAHYGQLGDFASLGNLIEGWAGYQSAPGPASQAYLEAARTWREGDGELPHVKSLYQQALHHDPLNREATDELIALCEQAGDQHALAEFLDGHLRTLETHGGEPALMALLYARLGDLWKGTFERPDVARPCYVRALELDPKCTTAAYGARKLAQEAGDIALAVELYGIEADSESDVERRIQLYIKQADVAASEVDDLDAAIRALRAALALAVGDVQIMHQLATYVGQRAARQTGEDAARDERRAAELYYQIAQAVPAQEALPYLEAALTALPSHDGALDLLERVAVKAGQAEVLPKYWVAYLANAGDGPEVDQRRICLAQAYERAGQFDDAIYCLEQARSDTQVEGLLAGLKAQRAARTSAPPQVQLPDQARRAATEAEAATEAVPSEKAEAEAEPEAATHAAAEEAPQAWDEAASDARATARPPARTRKASSERPLDVAPRLLQLRRAVHELVSARRSDEAAVHCREILELEPTDPEAFSLLESHYRKARDHANLRELLLASTRGGGLSVDARKLRLREVAAISETKLKDTDGAIEAWQSVVALDPTDIDAGKSLKRLLQKAQRWDDLAGVLERDAVATTNPSEKIDLISQIAAIHRDKRKDLVEAAEALRQLLSLKPDAAVRDELCDMLFSIESYADAVPLLRERVQEASDEREKLRLLRELVLVLDDKLHDGEAAFEVCLQILALRPKDTETLERMQRIDERSGNLLRLLSTLERRSMLTPRSERPALFLRMGEIAEREIGDVDKAAEYYGNVLDLEASHQGALNALYAMFERTGRYEDLVELLRERIMVEKEAARRVELYRRIARMTQDHLGRDDDAADAYRSLLAAQDDEEALRFLIARARTQSHTAELAELVPRLLPFVTEATEKSGLLYEHAERLASQLARPHEAIAALSQIVEQVDPEFEAAVMLLAELCENVADLVGLAKAMRIQLGMAKSADERVALARRLAELYEGELGVPEDAILMLQRWAADDPQDVAPQRRLQTLLASAGRNAELVSTLDALASLEEDFAARDQALLQAARVAFEALHDVDGAWQRLAPLAAECHEDAFALLAEISRKAGRAADLAALCVRAAQEASTQEVQGRMWSAAARVYAEDLHDTTQALEAGLRMLATDLSNRDYLTQVDQYAANAGAFARLSHVYDKLLKQAADDAERVELLSRHARVIDERALDASEALDRILRACGLAPNDDSLLARAEELAQRANRSEELLVVYDRKRSKTEGDIGKVELLLRAARLADGALRDRERANTYLKSALTVAKGNAPLAAEVVRAAEELDRRNPEHGPEEALRSLVRAHREIAEKADPETGAELILHAYALLKDRLSDERGAFDLLRQGTALFPMRDDIYETFVERAVAWKRLDAVDAHLSRAIDDAIDPKTAAVLLARRGRLLEGPLGRAQDAADVFAKLLQLRPDDSETAEKVRASLRRARRFQDLLLTLQKQMQRVKNADEKQKLLKEAASIWEDDLKNRWEALDAWRKVLDFAPADRDAQEAVARLDRRSVAPPRPVAELFADQQETTGAHAEAKEPAAAATPASTPDEAPEASEATTCEHEAATAPHQLPRVQDELQSDAPAAAAPAPLEHGAAFTAATEVPTESLDDDAMELVDDAEQEPAENPPPPRLTKPPTLPPRRSRSEPPLQPMAAARMHTAPPPPPSTRPAGPVHGRPSERPSAAPKRGASAPPPLPSRASSGESSSPGETRSSLLPPLPLAARPSSLPTAIPPLLPTAPRAVRLPSMPPPLPPSRRTGGLPAVNPEAGVSADVSASPALSGSRPPPLPSRKG